PIAGEALSVFAADVTDGHAIRTLHLVKAGEHVVDDPLGFLVDPRSVIVTDALAARLGVTTGATLPLRTPHGIETFTVRGVLPPGGAGRAFGGNLILMDVVGAQLVLGEDGLIDQVDVTLAPGVRVEDVERRLRAALPAGLEAIRPARRGEQIERYLASFQTLLSGLSGLALLAAIFVAGSAVATSVAARRRAHRRGSKPDALLAAARHDGRGRPAHGRRALGRDALRLARVRERGGARRRLRPGARLHAPRRPGRGPLPPPRARGARLRRPARRRSPRAHPRSARARGRRPRPGARPHDDGGDGGA